MLHALAEYPTTSRIHEKAYHIRTLDALQIISPDTANHMHLSPLIVADLYDNDLFLQAVREHRGL